MSARRLRVLVGHETSGRTRNAFLAMGHDAWSCDLLPAQDASNRHIRGDIFEVINDGWDLAILHPTCTFMTVSAEWAYADPDFERYPGVGYHQRVKPGTLTGATRRAARDKAVAEFERLMAADVEMIAAENPIGCLSSRYRKPDQIIQPFWFGDDASKATCLWLKKLPPLTIDPAKRCPGRMVDWPCGSGKMVERWSNQTDSGQNKLTPSDDRWSKRSDTYPGIAAAFAECWGRPFNDDLIGRAA